VVEKNKEIVLVVVGVAWRVHLNGAHVEKHQNQVEDDVQRGQDGRGQRRHQEERLQPLLWFGQRCHFDGLKFRP